MIDGLDKHGQATGTLLIGGKTYKAADLTPILQARNAASKAVSPARAIWLAAVLANKNERSITKTLISGLRQALIVAYAETPDTLADFGLTSRKKRVVKAQTKATVRSQGEGDARGARDEGHAAEEGGEDEGHDPHRGDDPAIDLDLEVKERGAPRIASRGAPSFPALASALHLFE